MLIPNRWKFKDRLLNDFVTTVLAALNGNLDSHNVPAITTISTGSTVYIGSANTNGSWRIVVSGGNLSVQKRESNVWNEKGSFLA